MVEQAVKKNGNGHGVAVLSELNELAVDRAVRGADIAIATNDRNQKRVGLKKAAIIGFAPSSYRSAPFAQNVFDKPDGGFELWGINELYKLREVEPAKFSCWFDIHDRRDGDISERDEHNLAWMKAQKFPLGLYMQDHYDDIPNSKRFPLERAIRFYRTTYFTNSISYMLALAGMAGRDENGNVIDEKEAYGEVHIYGVDMAQNDTTPGGQGEYAWQRPSCEYFIAYLRGLGIKVYIPPQSDLCFTPYLYGFQGDGQRFRKKIMQRYADLTERENAYKQQQQQLSLNSAATEGAAKAFANVAQTLLESGKISQQDYEELQKHAAATLADANQIREQSMQAMFAAAQLAGARDGLTYVERAWTGTVETYTPDARLYEPEPNIQKMPEEAQRHG